MCFYDRSSRLDSVSQNKARLESIRVGQSSLLFRLTDASSTNLHEIAVPGALDGHSGSDELLNVNNAGKFQILPGLLNFGGWKLCCLTGFAKDFLGQLIIIAISFVLFGFLF